MTTITDKTKVSLTLLVPLLVGCCWAIGIVNKIETMEEKTKKLEDLPTDVAVIKSEVHQIKESLDKLR